MNPTEHPLVAVYWLDATGPEGWHCLNETRDYKPATVHSYGRLVRDEGDRITIVPHHTTDEASGTITIPRSAITRIYRLTKGETLYREDAPDETPPDQLIADSIAGKGDRCPVTGLVTGDERP